AGTLFRLAATLLSNRELPGIGNLLQQAARAYAITGLLRAFALHASRGQLYLPLDLLARHGVHRNDVIVGKSGPALASALAEVRALARDHYRSALSDLSRVPQQARAAFLPLALVPLYLDRMETASYKPFEPSADVPQWRRQWRLWRAARTFSAADTL